MNQLEQAIIEQHNEIVGLRVENVKLREVLLSYLEQCLTCGGAGHYAIGPTDSPSQIQCYYCNAGLTALSLGTNKNSVQVKLERRTFPARESKENQTGQY